jgi:hypothetical protein
MTDMIPSYVTMVNIINKQGLPCKNCFTAGTIFEVINSSNNPLTTVLL